MAIVGVAGEVADSPRGGTLSLEKQEYEREFQVQTDNILDGPNTIVNAPGIPQIFDSYVFGNEYNIYALMREYSTPKRLAPNSLFWRVTCKYSTPAVGELDVANQQLNPLLEMPSVKFGFETFQDIMYFGWDALGNPQPFTNSAQEVLSPPPTRDSSRVILTISRNESILTPHPTLAMLYIDTLNSDVWWGQQPGIAKCQGIEVERMSKQLTPPGGTPSNFLYFHTQYIFHFRPDWNFVYLDQGSYYYTGSSSGLTRNDFISPQGHPYIGLLNGFGGSLPTGGVPVFTNPVAKYPSMPFGALNLPQSATSLIPGVL